MLGHWGWGSPVATFAGVAFFATAAALVAPRFAEQDRRILVILAASFALRLMALVLDEAYGLFPKADQNRYHEEAALLAAAWVNGGASPIPWTTAVGAYDHILAPVYLIFGPDAVVGRSLSVFQGMLATGLVYLLAGRVIGRRLAHVPAVLYAVSPSHVYIESELFRDPTAHVLILALLYAAILLVDAGSGPIKRVGLGAVVVLALMALWYLRSPTALVVLLPVAIILVWKQRPVVLRGHYRKIGVLSLAGAIVAVLGSTYTRMLTNLPRLTRYRDNWAAGGSAYLVNVRFDSIFEVVLFMPLGALYFLFTPFPWQIHNGLASAAFAENILFAWPVAIAAVATLVRREIHNSAPLVAIITLLVTASLAYGLIEGNVGTALRHRTQISWIFGIIAAPRLVRLAPRLFDRVPVFARIGQTLWGPPDPAAKTAANDAESHPEAGA